MKTRNKSFGTPPAAMLVLMTLFLFAVLPFRVSAETTPAEDACLKSGGNWSTFAILADNKCRCGLEPAPYVDRNGYGVCTQSGLIPSQTPSNTGSSLQKGQYQMLEPLPGIGDTTGGLYTASDKNFGNFVNSAFKLGIIVAALLAVIMIVIGGIEYMGSDSVFTKSSALGKLNNAIIGLIMALAIFLFLNTINPDLVNLNLKISPVEIPKSTAPTLLPGGYGVSPIDKTVEDEVRAKLKNFGGVLVNKTMCKAIGDTECTNVGDLSPKAIDKIIALGKKCACGTLTITGGTEYWLHGNRSTNMASNSTNHKPGGYVVDFSKKGNPAFTSFIQKNSLPPITTSIGTQYDMAGFGAFLDEKIDGNDAHWHVTFSSN